MQLSRIIPLVVIFVFFNYCVSAQVGIGITSPDSSALLDLTSTSRGFLAPRMNTGQMNVIGNPATGLTIFNSDSNQYFLYAGGAWIKMISSKDTVTTARSLSDKDVDTRVEVEQTADDDRIRFTVGGTEYFRMVKGNIEFNNTSGSIYLGEAAGANHNYSTTYPIRGNIAIGANALQNNLTGKWNTAIGIQSLHSITGDQNTAIGSYAGYEAAATTGSVYIGALAGLQMKGDDNVTIGAGSGKANSTGTDNVFVGRLAGSEATGSSNIFIGKNTGGSNMTGSGNIFLGTNVNAATSVDSTLMIDLGQTTTPLIYGNFAADSVTIHGALNINGNYTLPKTAGSNGYLMQTDGAGNASWVAPSNATSVQSRIQDVDADTKVDVEQSINEDKIHFTISGTDRMVLNGRNIELPNSSSSVIIGENAVQSAAPGSVVAIGAEALRNASGGGYNVALGYWAMRNQASGGDNAAVGANALQNTTGSFNAGLGSFSLQKSSGDNNTALGYQALQNNTSGSGNVAVGKDAGKNEMGSNKLYIDNSSTTTPLIYGDFSNDSLKINGTLNVNGLYNLPKTAGNNGHVMQTNGAGTTTWVSPSTLVTSSSQLTDADADTKVEVERTTDDDQIRFKLNGQDEWMMQGSRLENVNSGSLAIGRNAGLNEDGARYNVYYGINAGQDNTTGTYNTGIGNGALLHNTGGQNVAIGHQAGAANITGSGNIAIGAFTQVSNASGSGNISVGNETLHDNVSGSGNIAIGNGAGYSETGSNKLYIDNSSTNTPLIYGDFNNDSVRINGVLNVNGNYSLPKTAGSNGYIMQTNGAGVVNWVAPSSITPAKVQDADGDTKMETERTANSNKIHFSLQGTDRWIMNNNRLENAIGTQLSIGLSAGMNDVNMSSDNTNFGALAGKDNASGLQNVAVGYRALQQNTTSYNVGVGYAAGYSNTTGENNLAVGTRAMVNNISGSRNTVLGTMAMFYNKTGSGNVAIGYNAGLNDTTSDKLYIDNNSTSTPLIYGDFANDSLLVNGKLNINKAYTLPTTAGTNGYVLTTNGAGQTSWVAQASSFTEADPKVASTLTNRIPKYNGSALGDGMLYDNGFSIGLGTTAPNANALFDMQSSTKGLLIPRMSTTQRQAINSPEKGMLVYDSTQRGFYFYRTTGWTALSIVGATAMSTLTDADEDTKIEVEKIADEDKIRFSMGGTEYFRMNKGTLEFNNTNASIYLGEAAGANHAYSFVNLNNIGIGANSLQTNVSGINNTAIGNQALHSVADNDFNTAIGCYAGYTGSTITGATYIGYAAGRYNNGSENLMIGNLAGTNNTAGANNVFVGSNAGNANTGSGNVFLGKSVGASSGAVSNKLYIDNSDITSPLINGDFSSDSVRINGAFTVGSTTNATSLNLLKSGYLGLGTATPVRQLNVSATTGGSLTLTASGQTTDSKHWGMEVAGTTLYFHLANDAYSTTSNWLTVNRSGTSVSSIAFPAGNVIVGGSSPASTLDVAGSLGLKVKAAQAAGTNHPDATAATWIYTTGTGTITLPAASSCSNRTYIIVNKTGAIRNISSYLDMSNAAQTILANATSIFLVSDGTSWQQVR